LGLNLKYKIIKKNTTNFILNLKDKIQEFMLCVKGKIHRKILVTLKFQEDVVAKIKRFKFTVYSALIAICQIKKFPTPQNTWKIHGVPTKGS
jgi:hypothetical protein